MKNRETISEKNLKFRHHDFHTKNEKETTRRTTCFFFFFQFVLKVDFYELNLEEHK